MYWFFEPLMRDADKKRKTRSHFGRRVPAFVSPFHRVLLRFPGILKGQGDIYPPGLDVLAFPQSSPWFPQAGKNDPARKQLLK
jgi:hypothetical protein